MATTESAAERLHAATTSTTAETWGLTEPVKQVVVTNHEAAAGDTVYVTIATGRTAAQAEGNIVTAVALADETFAVLPQTSKRIFVSTRETYVAGSIIGDGSTYSIEGTPWYD